MKTKPIRTQSKPILERMNVNFCATGYYESKPAIRVAGKPTFAVRKGRPNNPNVEISIASCGLAKARRGPRNDLFNRFLAEFTLERSEGLEMTCGLFYKANSSIEKKNILFDLLKFFLQRFLRRGKIVAFQRPETDIRRKADRNFSMEARMTRRVRSKKIVKGFVFWLFTFSLLFFFCPLLISGCNKQEAEIDRIRKIPADKRKAELLKLLDRKFENPDAHFELGQLYHAEGQWSQTQWRYERVLNFDPVHRPAQAAMVKLFLDSGDAAKAKTYTDVYMSQVAGSVNRSLRLGLAFQEQQLDEYALACYQQALSLAPNSAKVHKQMGYYYLSKNDKVRAKEYLIRSFELDPKQPEVAGELGRLGVEVRIP